MMDIGNAYNSFDYKWLQIFAEFVQTLKPINDEEEDNENNEDNK